MAKGDDSEPLGVVAFRRFVRPVERSRRHWVGRTGERGQIPIPHKGIGISRPFMHDDDVGAHAARFTASTSARAVAAEDPGFCPVMSSPSWTT